MINRFIKFLSSMKFVVLLLLIFAFSIGYATFIENDFGTASAKALIYNTWWFELLLIILAASLIVNMIKHKLFRKEKLFLHQSRSSENIYTSILLSIMLSIFNIAFL